jgi:hypothetical protein
MIIDVLIEVLIEIGAVLIIIGVLATIAVKSDPENDIEWGDID